MEDETGAASTEAGPTTEAPARSDSPYPLAADANGNPIEVPTQAVAWRVRRGGGKRGRPSNVFDASTGRQLEIPLGASLQDLVETNVAPDRYLLYPVDAQRCIIPGVIAVTEVPNDDGDGGEDRIEDRDGLKADSRDPMVAICARQLGVIEAQSTTLQHALASAVSGYAPVRPVAPTAPTPIVMDQAPQPPAPSGNAGGVLDTILNLKPEQMMQLAGLGQQLFAMIRAGVGAMGGGGNGGGAP